MIHTTNKYQPVPIIYLSICLIALLVSLATAFNYEINNPIKELVGLFIPSSIAKFIWTFSLGFFISLTTVFALTFLIRKNVDILWYVALFLLVAMGYLVALLPYYFENPIFYFIFYSLNNGAILGTTLCGIRIVQDVTESTDAAKFNSFSLKATLGYLCCLVGYFTQNQYLYLLLYSTFCLICLILVFDCYLILKVAVKQKKLGNYFILNTAILSCISFCQAFPVTSQNYELVFNIRLISTIALPFAIAAFCASIFSLKIKRNKDNEDTIDTLMREKQAILEAQNETLALQVAEQISELKDLNSTKDRLFSIIGHDLRSPIASLKGVLLLLDNQQLSREEFDELLQHLHKNVDNVHGTLENLLQWSLSQMKGMKPSLKSFEVNDIVEQTVELFRNVAAQKHIDLQSNISEHLKVFADENHVRAVIRNLLNNALKFTPQNGKIAISGEFKDSYVRLQITDSGIGINTDEIQTIFTNPKLKQGTSGEKGTGLGLILCKDLIKQNYGEISVKSELQKGTTFEILIPQKAEYS
jgi:signal transduction histidine kinase